MDFTYDDEHEALRDAVRGLYKSYDTEHRRSVTAKEPGYDTTMWSRLAELGVLWLPFSEDDGGSGAGPVETGIAAEEIGRANGAEPLAWCVVLPGTLLDVLATGDQRTLIGELASGERPICVVRGEDLRVVDQRLTGVAEPVFYAGSAQTFLVFAEDGLYLTEEGDRSSYATADSGRAARIEFDNAAATPLGTPGRATEAALTKALAATRIALCHEAVGAMEESLRATSAYLTTRKQFGVTLNRFQSLTFRAADMFVSAELARSVTMWASMVLAEGSPEAVADAGRRAKLQVAKSARHVSQESIQLHGGIGVTAEFSIAHYAARLTAINHLLGTADDMVRELSGSVAEHSVLDPMR